MGCKRGGGTDTRWGENSCSKHIAQPLTHLSASEKPRDRCVRTPLTTPRYSRPDETAACQRFTWRPPKRVSRSSPSESSDFLAHGLPPSPSSALLVRVVQKREVRFAWLNESHDLICTLATSVHVPNGLVQSSGTRHYSPRGQRIRLHSERHRRAGKMSRLSPPHQQSHCQCFRCLLRA